MLSIPSLLHPLRLALTAIMACCVLGSHRADAALLLDENFTGEVGLPAGWTVFDEPTLGETTIGVGHEGNNVNGGTAIRYKANANGPNSIPGGFLKPPLALLASQPFTIAFDFKMVSNSASDDAVFVLGDLSDPYGTNASAQNKYHLFVFNETAISNDFFLVTEGTRAPVQEDFAGASPLTPDIWYRTVLTWTPTSGFTGNFKMDLFTASTGALRGTFTKSITLPQSTLLGFGAYNDIALFDNIVVNGTDANALAAVADAITVGVGGALGFDPTTNDTGSIAAGSVTVVTPPLSGTAVYDALQGQVVYRHTGSAAGIDSFTYRIANTSGSTADGTVNVTISDAMRLANTTLKLPLDPPPGGALQMLDALPGLTFDGAVAMATVPGTPKALIIASINGKVWMIPDTTVAAPVKKELFSVASLSNFTRGRSIYGIVCHPQFATNGLIIVNYQGNASRLPPIAQIPNLDVNTTVTCDLRVSGFSITPARLTTLLTSTNSATIAATQAQVLATELPYLNVAEQHLFHTINDCQFGQDGYLYVSFGDEGDQGEPYRNAQRITKDQFSSIIRIDVNRAAGNLEPNAHYSIPINPGTGFANFKIPADNPYVGPAPVYNGVAVPEGDLPKVRTEIWATGMRNPFKMHIDPPTGDVWVGDVGRDAWEEVDVIRKGDNGGWSYWEGNHTTGIPHAVAPPSYKAPEFEYAHTNGNNCIIGGVFYRGSAYTGLSGKYICGDYGSGRLWKVTRNTPGTALVQDLGVGTLGAIVDFEIDAFTGEILILQHEGGKKVWRLREGTPPASTFPVLLSQTGAFADLQTLTPNPGVVPYEPNLTFWSDHAKKSRYFVIKNTQEQVGYARDNAWTFPIGMTFIKHFDFDLNRDFPGTNRKRLETRFLVRNATGTYGVSYRWNEQGTDATLVGIEGVDFDLPVRTGGVLNGGAVTGGTITNQPWHIPTRGECLTCHNTTAGHALSFHTQQLNHHGELGGVAGNYLSLLSQAGYLAAFTDTPAALPRFYKPSETSVNLEERVRSYLAVNCAYCHQPGTGAAESWDARGHLSVDDMKILHALPTSESTPDFTARLIMPGDTAKSVIFNRIHARGTTYNGYTQMPPLATAVRDDEGIALIEAWITSHANTAPAFAANTPSAVAISENSAVGESIATLSVNDLDVRGAVTDNSRLRFTLASGDASLFFVDPVTGQISVNGVLDYERATSYSLQIAVTDDFANNPRTSMHTISVSLQDVGNGDATGDANENGLPDGWELALSLGATHAGGDSDADGVVDFFEFLAGADPLVPESARDAFTLRVAEVSTAPDLGIRVEWRARNGVLFGGDYALQTRTLSGAWETLAPGQYSVLSVVADGPGFSRWSAFIPATDAGMLVRLATQP